MEHSVTGLPVCKGNTLIMLHLFVWSEVHSKLQLF